MTAAHFVHTCVAEQMIPRGPGGDCTIHQAVCLLQRNMRIQRLQFVPFWKTNQNQTGPLITAPATGEITGPQMVSRRTKTQQNMYKRSNRRAVILKSFWSWWFTVDVNRAVPHSPALVENQKTSLWTFTACLYFILPLTLGREISCPEQMLHLDCPDR